MTEEAASNRLAEIVVTETKRQELIPRGGDDGWGITLHRMAQDVQSMCRTTTPGKTNNAAGLAAT
jgi:hypothetical protein